MDGLDILAVDDAPGHVVGLGPPGEVVDGRGHAHRAVLAVEVVGDDEDDRGRPDRGHVQRLVEGADVGGPVTGEGEGHVRLGPQPEGHGRPDRDGQARADDGVGPDVALAGVDEVHRAAEALGAAAGLAHELGHGRLEGHAQGQCLAVAAVRVGLDVPGCHGRDGPHRDRLLALAQMGRALDAAAQEELLDPVLEDADADHLPVPLEPWVVGVGHLGPPWPVGWWASVGSGGGGHGHGRGPDWAIGSIMPLSAER